MREVILTLAIWIQFVGCGDRGGSYRSSTWSELKNFGLIFRREITDHGDWSQLGLTIQEKEVTEIFHQLLTSYRKEGIFSDEIRWYFDGDAWGRPYRAFGKIGINDKGILRLESAGQDGGFETSDDVSFALEEP